MLKNRGRATAWAITLNFVLNIIIIIAARPRVEPSTSAAKENGRKTLTW
jgi:hypothetical protein